MKNLFGKLKQTLGGGKKRGTKPQDDDCFRDGIANLQDIRIDLTPDDDDSDDGDDGGWDDGGWDD